MNTLKLICYDYEYRRPCEKSMPYDADKYYIAYRIISRNWYNYLMRAGKNYSILDIAVEDFPSIPRMVLSDIVNSIAISMSI